MIKDHPTYPSKTGDATAQRTRPYNTLADGLPWPVRCDENCSQRARQVWIVEWAAPPRDDQTVFNQILTMVLTQYAVPAHVAAAMAERRRSDQLGGKLGQNLKVGEDAYMHKLGEPDFSSYREMCLEVKQGIFHIVADVKCPTTYYEPKLRALMVRVAEMIVAKVKPVSGSTITQPPPVVTTPRLEIAEGPSGRPNPVAPGGAVQCGVLPRYGSGGTLRYQWTATGGSFNNAQAQNPTWTAPTAGATQYLLTVYITAPDGSSIGASYLQKTTAPTWSPPPARDDDHHHGHPHLR